MEHSNIQAAVEAVLFASGEPVESEKLCEAVGIAKDPVSYTHLTLPTILLV